MKNLYQIRNDVVISSITGNLPTDSPVCLPVSCIIFGMNGTFYVETENGPTESGNCFLLAADTTNKVVPVDCKGFVIIFFDAVSREHYFLSRTYHARGTVKLQWNGDDEFLKRSFSKMNEAESNAFLNSVFLLLFNEDRRSIPNYPERRILLIDQFIRENIREKLNNKILAEKIHLSESRFYHFFKEQTQVNVSRYIQWLRLKVIFEKYFKAEPKLSSLITPDLFTDLSHFIKAFRSFFGESPRRLLRK